MALDISFFLLGLNVNEHALPNGTEPLIFLDFKNGDYIADGVSVAIGTLLAENEDYGEWDAGTMIVPGTGVSPPTVSAAPVFTGDALDLILSGSTTLTIFSCAASDGGEVFRYEMVDNFIDYGSYYYSNSSFTAVPNSSLIGDQVTPDVTEASLAFGIHKSAITMIDGKISRSTDGAAIITINPAAAWIPAMGAMGFVVPNGVIVESIGIYPAQPDGDLPTLSTP